jgi:hypothetical protein
MASLVHVLGLPLTTSETDCFASECDRSNAATEPNLLRRTALMSPSTFDRDRWLGNGSRQTPSGCCWLFLADYFLLAVMLDFDPDFTVFVQVLATMLAVIE